VTAMHAEFYPFRLALRAPLVTGGVSVRFRAGFLVSLSADGLVGWGEASPLPGWSRNTLLETDAALRAALDALNAGRESVLDLLAGDLSHTPHARAGVAGAWADLEAQRAGRTLAARLAGARGHAVASAVAVNALVAVPEPSEVEQAVRDAAGVGFGAVKLKVGSAAPAVDVERVRAARSSLGPEAELRLDANGAWDPSTALDVLSRVHDCDIAYCEEPVTGIDAIASVGQRSPIPVAVDESVRGEADARRALDLGVGTLIVKPQALGGPDVALSIAARAQEAGASVVVTSFLDSAVGVAHALHVAAAVDAAASQGRAHGLATSGLLVSDVAETLPVVNGAMAVPAAPGLGLTPEAARARAARPSQPCPPRSDTAPPPVRLPSSLRPRGRAKRRG